MQRSARLASATVALAAAAVSWPLSADAQASEGDPVLVQSSRMDVVIGAPALRYPENDRARFARFVAGCRTTMRFQAADSAAVVSIAPPIFETRGATIVVFSVLHTEGLQANCGDRHLQSTVLAAQGVRVSYDTSYSADRDIDRVVLRRGALEIAPVEVRREPVRRLGPNGFLTPRAHWVGMAIELASIPPGVDGEFADIVLDVYTLAGGEPDRVVIPSSALRAVWVSMLEARAMTNASGVAPMALPAPRDAALRAAHEAYSTNDLVTAARLGAHRIVAPDLGGMDRLQSHLQLGLSFAALGDTAAARVVLSRLVDVEPCVELTPSAPRAARDLLAGIRRPAARCTAQSVGETALRSALLPGFGRPGSREDFPLRAGIAGSIGLSILAAIQQGSAASATYDDYLAFQVSPVPTQASGGAGRLFRDAEAARVRGQALWGAAAVIWGAQLATTLWREHQHARRLEGLRAFTEPRRTGSLGLAPLLGASEVGLSLLLHW